MSERGPLHVLANPVPSDDNGDRNFPLGYSPHQLIGAWTWETNSGKLGADQLGSVMFQIKIIFTKSIIIIIATTSIYLISRQYCRFICLLYNLSNSSMGAFS